MTKKKVSRLLRVINKLKKSCDLVLKEQADCIGPFIYGTKNTGQLRRDSMELTRCLADLRNPKTDK